MTDQMINMTDRDGTVLLRGMTVAVLDAGRTVAGVVIAPGTVACPGFYMERVVIFPRPSHVLRTHGSCPHAGHSGHSPELCPDKAGPFAGHTCENC